MTEAAPGRLPSCPPWCTADHSEWEATHTATHRNTPDTADALHGQRLLVMVVMETGKYERPFEIWVWTYRGAKSSPMLRLTPKDAITLAGILTAIRATDKLAPLLRKAAALAADLDN